MAAFGIHELRRQTAEEFPEASYDEIFGGTRDRVVDAVKSANLGERAAKLRLPEVRRPERPDERRRGGRGAHDWAPTESMSAASGEDARLERLERLGGLHEKGVLTDEELAAEKKRILEE